MDPPTGFWSSLWRFICFLPFFIGLLILGFIKGVILCPLICLLMTFGNSAIILGLWPVHCFWTYLCILRTNKFGPVLKLVLCICIAVPLLLWPPVAILANIVGGAAYGLFSPIFATFDAISEGNTDKFFHCIYDGTWDTVTGCCTIIRDFKDVCYHSYFSYMDDLKRHEEKYYEIRLLYLPGAIIVGALGLFVDFVVISFVAVCKFPYMLFKGWRRLFQDCIGREGPFLETMCVPFAGLAILLWPLAVGGALLASMVSSIFIGAYAAVIVYQESSVWLGLCYIVATLSIYDEYSNDVLHLPEGSCFPNFKGYQDTLYVRTNRQFYRNCDVYGTVDFIFGNAIAVLQNCNIYVRRPLMEQSNTITAQNKRCPDDNTGIVLHNCSITAASDLKPVQPMFKTYLGRPWGNCSTTVVMKSFLDGLIDPAGWLPWQGNISTVYYGEYMNTGSGANTSGRVKWPGYHIITVVEEAEKFTVKYFLNQKPWLEATGVPFNPDL